MTRLGVLKRLAIVTAVLLGALNYVALVRLGFAGQVPDLNPLGASEMQILAFRDALGFEGRALFNGTYRPLDFGFLVCLTGLLALASQMLRPRRFWWAVMLFGIAFGLADLTENTLMAQLINAEPSAQDAALAAQINLATRIKFAALCLAGAAAITSWRQRDPRA